MSYNPLRQLMEVQDWIGLTKIQNDALGRAVKVTYPDKKKSLTPTEKQERDEA